MSESGGRSLVVDSHVDVDLVSFASGSSGNSIFVRSRDVAGLIDCGIPPSRLRRELRTFDLTIADLSFALITHEHSDHVRSIPALRTVGVPLVCSPGTARTLGLAPHEWIPLGNRGRFTIGSIELHGVTTAHDAAEPIGVRAQIGGVTAALFTDLGSWNEAIVEAARDADVVVIEANHNLDMLRRGPYPAYLKRRVLSDVGHLSNDDCGRLTASIRDRSARRQQFFLAHLSTTNNTPLQAESDVAQFGGWEPGGLRALPRAVTMDLLAAALDIRAVPPRPRQMLLDFDDRGAAKPGQ